MAGILDLRLAPDRFLDLDTDRAKAERLAALDDLSFAELVEAYWRMTPEVPAPLGGRYTQAMLRGPARAEAWLSGPLEPSPGDAVLDVGCGTGGLVVAAARRGAVVTGIDIALRWLVIARRQCEEAGTSARLLAADGAGMPFRPRAFHRVFSVNVVEHAADQRGLLQWCLQAARPDGGCLVVVLNRFGLAPDPVSGLVGVSWLPRPLAAPYVRWRRNTRYFVRPLSVGHLRSLVGAMGGVSVGPAPLPGSVAPTARGEERLRSAYERLRGRPATRAVLTWVAPHLQVVTE